MQASEQKGKTSLKGPSMSPTKIFGLVMLGLLAAALVVAALALGVAFLSSLGLFALPAFAVGIIGFVGLAAVTPPGFALLAMAALAIGVIPIVSIVGLTRGPKEAAPTVRYFFNVENKCIYSQKGTEEPQFVPADQLSAIAINIPYTSVYQNMIAYLALAFVNNKEVPLNDEAAIAEALNGSAAQKDNPAFCNAIGTNGTDETRQKMAKPLANNVMVLEGQIEIAKQQAHSIRFLSINATPKEQLELEGGAAPIFAPAPAAAPTFAPAPAAAAPTPQYFFNVEDYRIYLQEGPGKRRIVKVEEFAQIIRQPGHENDLLYFVTAFAFANGATTHTLEPFADVLNNSKGDKTGFCAAIGTNGSHSEIPGINNTKRDIAIPLARKAMDLLEGPMISAAKINKDSSAHYIPLTNVAPEGQLQRAPTQQN